jgi:magnesium-transporting ATPase (P-type)
MLINITKWTYKWSQILPKSMKNSIIFQILTYFISLSLMTYIGMFIVLLDWSDALAFHNNFYHWGTILLVLFTIFSFIIPPPRSKNKKEELTKAND